MSIASRTRSMDKVDMFKFVKQTLDTIPTNTTDEKIMKANNEKIFIIFFTVADKIIEMERKSPEKNNILFVRPAFLNTMLSKTDEFSKTVQGMHGNNRKHFRQIRKGLHEIAKNRGYDLNDDENDHIRTKTNCHICMENNVQCERCKRCNFESCNDCLDSLYKYNTTNCPVCKINW